MLWARIRKVLEKKFILTFLYICVLLLTRLPRLKTDTINPDAVNWHYRTQQFVVGLKQLAFKKTYQHYHPGVILMWITGIPVEMYKQVTNIQHYTHINFLDFHLIAKLSLTFVHIILLIACLLALSKIIGFGKAFFCINLLSFEPFFVGNSRLYHMDALFTLLVFLGLLVFFISLYEKSLKFSLVAGLLFSLSFLTKSVGIGLLPFSLLVGLFYAHSRPVKKIYARNLVVLYISFVVFTVLLFPALWSKPIYFLSEIFSEGLRVGVRKGHSQIFFGEVTKNPGFLFYPLVLLLKISPFVVLGFVLFLFAPKRTSIKNEKKDIFLLLSSVFYIGYLFVMTFPSKKLDRYMLVLFPYFSILAVLGYEKFLKIWRTSSMKKVALLSLLVICFYVFPLIKLFPYYFTYTSPLFGTSYSANKIIGQKSFGVGIVELRNYIYEKYGSDTALGFIDTKPMKSIHPSSKVFDMRINGTSDYDLMILGINEEVSEKVLRSGDTFVLDSIFPINKLEYWRVYVKET